jgi:hypothetical protein
MATVSTFGPYYYNLPNGLQPGQAYNVYWGPNDSLAPPGTLHVTGFASGTEGGVHNVWVSDMSTSNDVVRKGDILLSNYGLYATFGNSGSIPIFGIVAFITLSRP